MTGFFKMLKFAWKIFEFYEIVRYFVVNYGGWELKGWTDATLNPRLAYIAKIACKSSSTPLTHLRDKGDTCPRKIQIQRGCAASQCFAAFIIVISFCSRHIARLSTLVKRSTTVKQVHSIHVSLSGQCGK